MVLRLFFAEANVFAALYAQYERDMTIVLSERFGKQKPVATVARGGHDLRAPIMSHFEFRLSTEVV